MHLKAKRWSIEIPTGLYKIIHSERITDNELRSLLGPMHPSLKNEPEILAYIGKFCEWIKDGKKGTWPGLPKVSTSTPSTRTLSPRKIVTTPTRRITFKECTFPVIGKLSVLEEVPVLHRALNYRV